MAQQKGIIPLRGTIGNITFYKSGDAYLAREKGGIDANRIATDPAFQRTRENGAEFGNSSRDSEAVILPSTQIYRFTIATGFYHSTTMLPFITG